MNSYAKKRLEGVYQKAEIIPYGKDSRFILMSDCHRGVGNGGDNFLPNQNLFFGALEYYYSKGFTYIELGDGDELWENRSISPIIEEHSDAFWMMKRFAEENRLYMLYGNHDLVKRKRGYVSRYCERYYCESEKCWVSLLGGLVPAEGMILEDEERRSRIFLVHGHQGEMLNDRLWRLSKFLVRYVWRSLELIGVRDPTRAGRSHRVKDRIEKRLDAFAESQNVLLVAGHTHRPFFSEPLNGRYFNDGSCVHPRCITGIEIADGEISLVKWAVLTRRDRCLSVEKTVLEGPVKLEAYDSR